MDLLLGWLGLNFLSVFVSLLAGLLYVKLYPCFAKLYKKCGCLVKLYEKCCCLIKVYEKCFMKLYRKCCCKLNLCCSKRTARVARVLPYHSNKSDGKIIKENVNIQLNPKTEKTTSKDRTLEIDDNSSNSEIEIRKQHSSSALPTPKHQSSEKNESSIGGGEIGITKRHSSTAWTTPKDQPSEDGNRGSDNKHDTAKKHSSSGQSKSDATKVPTTTPDEFKDIDKSEENEEISLNWITHLSSGRIAAPTTVKLAPRPSRRSSRKAKLKLIDYQSAELNDYVNV